MRSWTWGRRNRGKRGDQEREKDPENEDKERRKKNNSVWPNDWVI